LGGLLIFLGLILFFRSFAAINPEEPTKTHWRPLLCIIGAALLFALLIDKAGMVLSAAIMMLLGGFGGWDFRWKEQLIGMIVMPAVCVAIFSYGLGLPFKLFPWS
jgi:hypothetical protein